MSQADLNRRPPTYDPRMRMGRTRSAAGLLVISALLLSGCIANPSVSGSGVVTVTWDNAAARSSGSGTPGSWGDTIALCPAGVTQCQENDWSYAYLPPVGSTGVQLIAGMSVFDRSFQIVSLPPGQYALQVLHYVSINTVGYTGGMFTIEISSEARDLTIWHKAVGRPDAATRCPAGFGESWAQWPNDGTGGFVCTFDVYAYYPDIPVQIEGSPDLDTWMVSIGRADADSECPTGFTPSWAQWPNDGTGGFTCNRQGTEEDLARVQQGIG